MWSDVNLRFCHRTNLMFLLCHIIVQRHLDLLITYTLLDRTNKKKMNQRQSVPCSTWYVSDRRWEINISILNLLFQQRFLGQPGHIRTFHSKKKIVEDRVRETQPITHLKLPTIKTKTRKTYIFYYSSIYFVGVLVYR